MAGDPRWEAATAGVGDPYDWIRREHDPQVRRGTPALFDAPTLRPDEWPVALDLMSAESLDGGIVRLRYSVRISRS